MEQPNPQPPAMKPSPVALGEGAFGKKKEKKRFERKGPKTYGTLVFLWAKSRPKNDKILYLVGGFNPFEKY